MSTQSVIEISISEQKLLQLMRRLLPEQVAEVLDFAEFLAAKNGKAQTDEFEEAPLGAGDEQWEKVFAKPEAKHLLRAMAREAREDYLAGRTTDITITEDGRLAPG